MKSSSICGGCQCVFRPLGNIIFIFAAFDEWPRYTTPEILLRACPPYGKLGLDHCAHRFTSQFGVDKKKETCSRAFGACRTWQEALAEVHAFLWGKFLETGKAAPDGTAQFFKSQGKCQLMSCQTWLQSFCHCQKGSSMDQRANESCQGEKGVSSATCKVPMMIKTNSCNLM